jgi:pantoate--beta-alanine ligase
MIDAGVKDTTQIIEEMRKILKQVSSIEIEYVSIVAADTLQNIDHIRGKVLIAVAVRIGSARLIDNILLDTAK